MNRRRMIASIGVAFSIGLRAAQFRLFSIHPVPDINQRMAKDVLSVEGAIKKNYFGFEYLLFARYCSPSLFHQCGNGTDGSSYFKSCYFGRGAIQASCLMGNEFDGK
jgi:hypothetical protein